MVVTVVRSSVPGQGKMDVSVTGLMLTVETFFVQRDPEQQGNKARLYIKDVDLKMKDDQMKIELGNVNKHS